MITIFENKINTLNQISYNKFLENINLFQLPCSCGIAGGLIKHGHYKRFVKTKDGKILLSILRVKCKNCCKTHAIFFEDLVPYSQILLSEQISILNTYESKSSFEAIMIHNESIDESNIRYIIRQYLKHWKERIVSFDMSFSHDITSLSKQCLNIFKRQFMQIKSVPNILFT